MSAESMQLSKEIFTIFNSKVTDILTTVSNTPMEVTMGDVQPGTSLDMDILSDLVKLEINLTGFIEGSIYYVLEKNSVARLADLMMMGDGSAEYDPDHDEAISELFNQILGAFITDASAQYAAEMSNVGITASATKFEDAGVSNDEVSFFEGNIVMDGFDDMTYYIIYKESMMESILDNISGQIGESEDLIDDISGEAQPSFDDVLSQFDFEETTEEESVPTFDDGNEVVDSEAKNLENIYDISLDVSIELGKTRMSIRKILGLSSGSVIELDKLAGEPVDILVNQKLIAKGEVVVIDESFGVRLTSLVTPEERIRSFV